MDITELDTCIRSFNELATTPPCNYCVGESSEDLVGHKVPTCASVVRAGHSRTGRLQSSTLTCRRYCTVETLPKSDPVSSAKNVRLSLLEEAEESSADRWRIFTRLDADRKSEIAQQELHNPSLCVVHEWRRMKAERWAPSLVAISEAGRSSCRYQRR